MEQLSLTENLGISMANAIDFSRTQRLLLLIDLNPLLQSQNPNPNYITTILTTSKLLLSLPSLSSSLFSYKLFFSSLSPLRSASTLHRLLPNPSPASLSFNSPSQTLNSLFQIIHSVSLTQSATHSPSVASHTASSLLQLAHDYDWESQIENLSGTRRHDPICIRSNLILLLSPVCKSMKCLAEFMRLDVNDDCLSDLDGYSAKFRDCFGVVNDAFNSRDIHFCWVDVCGDEENVESNEFEERSLLFMNEIRKFGWGFCSTDSIVLGSALVPFGLIYPNIGLSFKFLDCHGSDKRIRGQLNLEITDVSGKPLECKCCNLELMLMKVFSKPRSSETIRNLETGSSDDQAIYLNKFVFGNLSDGNVKLHVTDLRRYEECEKIEEFSLDHFLVQSAESGRREKDGLDSFFADRVLELLASENTGLLQKHPFPTWQIFLNFLYREGYWAFLTVSNINGDSFMGILKPFTVHSAFLSILDNSHCSVQSIGRSNLSMTENTISQGDVDSQKNSSSSGKDVPPGDGKKRRNKKHIHRDLTWNSFCKMAYESSDLDLAEVYFDSGLQKSKKLMFLKCWMKQMKNHRLSHGNIPEGSSQTAPDVAKSSRQKETDVDEKLTLSYHQSDEPLSAPFNSDESRLQDDSAFESCPETSEAFFSNLPKKIQHGLESDGVDLKILAERLVNSSIFWLHKKYEIEEKVDESCTREVAELIKLLLREPKELKESKDKNWSLQAPNQDSSPDLVREYELQIFLRMEILRSELGESIKGFMKPKLVKQICSLLEIIQYLVEGGFHGDVSLYDYVERTIKTRYCGDVGDVVKRIYDAMDLLPFGEENEPEAVLPNSEDGGNPCKHKIQEAENGSSMNDEHAQKLNEARDRRERARRFVSFTSRMPDLQRVWAPKAAKVKPVKESRRKKRRGASYGVVCETPLTTAADRPSACNGSSGSVYKALFQEDDR